MFGERGNWQQNNRFVAMSLGAGERIFDFRLRDLRLAANREPLRGSLVSNQLFQ
jgi:hypothetical protein